MSLDETLSSLKRLHNNISNFIVNSTKLKAADQFTIADCDARLALLEKYWKRLDEEDEAVSPVADANKQRTYFKDNLYLDAQARYLEARAWLKEKADNLVAPPVDLRRRDNTGSSTGLSTSQVTLERLKLPKFSGRQKDWECFKEQFSSLIVTDVNIPDVVKLQHLTNSLDGDAAQHLKGIHVIGSNFATAWKALCNRYDNNILRFTVQVQSLLDLPGSSNESSHHLNQLLSAANQAINTFKLLGRPVDHWDDFIVFFVVEKLARSTRLDWARMVENKNVQFPTFTLLKTFLEERVRTLDWIIPEEQHTHNPIKGNVNKKSKAMDKGNTRHFSKQVSAHVVTPERKGKKTPTCTLCGETHWLWTCQKFTSSPITQRLEHVMKERLCRNCLCPGHTVKECNHKGRCFVCSEKHHTRLHAESTVSCTTTSSNEGQDTASTSCHTTVIKTLPTTTEKSVLLATACVILESSSGVRVTVRALLDTGAEECFVSEHIAQLLALRKQSTSVVVQGVGGRTSATARCRVSLTLKSVKNSNFSYDFSALVLSRLSSVLPSRKASILPLPHLDGLSLADPQFGIPGRVDCILSAPAFAAALLTGVRTGPPGTPTAIQTVFGWVLMGFVPSSSETNRPSERTAIHHVTVNHNLSSALSRFWEIEEVPSTPVWTPQETECYDHFKSTHRRNDSGVFIVRLPFLTQPHFTNTRPVAETCLLRLERRFQRKPDLRDSYVQFMDEYKNLTHMQKVSSEEVIPVDTFYLPHHPVVKSDGSNKIRVVFNASQVDSSGVSLNSVLHTGPKLQEDLVAILLRWRFYQVAFTCDIVKMFRQFMVYPADSEWQRILWRTSPEHTLLTYRLTTVTYGTACAPFLANACLLQLADDEEHRFPMGAQALRHARYVDDFFVGADSTDQANQIQGELTEILKTAGMALSKWAYSCPLPSSISLDQSTRTTDLEVKSEDTVSTLGLLWQPGEDTFRFKVRLPTSCDRITKRSILSETARLFDPIGWLSPVIISAKIIMQNLWLTGVDWDDEVPNQVANSWSNFRDKLPEIESIRIPRSFLINEATSWQLHAFCDASERAYATALYLVSSSQSSLMVAKSKVAPVKVLSIPKLELCGASLLVKLVKYTLSKLHHQPSRIICWTDSKVVLAWLNSHPSRWKPFVANRVSDIVSSLPEATWFHVTSKDNPADLATRGVDPSTLLVSRLWWHGPQWLTVSDNEWPPQVTTFSSDQPESRKINCAHAVSVKENTLFMRLLEISSYDLIVAICAYALRWKNRVIYKKSPRNDWLSASEREQGRIVIIRLVQAQSFPTELAALSAKNLISKDSPIRRLSPILDINGIIRVGGRLQNSYLDQDEQHPIILPTKHVITKLLITRLHKITCHGGYNLVSSQLLRNYWIVRGRNFIRSVLRNCVKCARFNAKTTVQQMAPLPAMRVRPSRPFTFTGLDYAGPFWIKSSPGRGRKAFKGYVAVFVCMTIKAIHLEVVSDLTTAAFLAAFKRFVARRGLCKVVYSDNGTNFQGGNAELRRLFNEASAVSQEIAASLSRDEIEWRFIPPRAPNFGGLWEANVGAFKRHLKRVVGDTRLTFEEMCTVVTQIEACLNSRPLLPIESSNDDIQPLTPGHFLIGGPLLAAPEPHADINKDHDVCSRWHLTSRMRNHFWQRWRREIMAQMQQRSKWLKPTHNLKEGDIVIIKDLLLPPTKWPLARITETHPGSDQLTRVVSLRTANSTLTRPVSKLIWLPVSSSKDDQTDAA